ncbi:MAG: tetratricopeptide repeat protein [Acidiferrobacterales bacterium]
MHKVNINARIEKKPGKSDLGHMNTFIGILLLVFAALLSFLSLASAASTSPPRTAQRVDNELQSLGYFPEMFGAGLAAYNNGNYQQALRIWRPMAEAGHTLAQYNLGVAYARGLGVERDVLVASSWWKRSALQGNPDASYNLGLVYARGDGGIAPDMTRAAHWWQQAAIHGDAAAQFNLGMMYARGEGVQQDIETAMHWWQLSADQGFNGAKKMLDQIAIKSQ